MHVKIERAIRQAMEARQKADDCDDARMRDQWLNIACTWEELAASYEVIQKIMDDDL